MGDAFLWDTDTERDSHTHTPSAASAFAFALARPRSSSPFLPPLTAVTSRTWRLAENRAAQILRLVQPTADSNRKRMRVIRFVQNLIGTSIGTHVVAFGSVPLKTFLPDGDVDLTALVDSVVGDTLVNDVRHILESEESNIDAELEVKDVKFIEAEVRLVKCLIENVIVDVSFNQIGGLCTLCFLELVDDYIGKDHLFKRSIILIKSWCYYESRILGAHHGLFSTYALETLVLYIFNLFHGSLVGPLSVLYKFLEYYSKFDWDKYCISLYGPVRLSSLPNSDVEMIDPDCDELLFTRQVVTNILTSFCFPPQEQCSKEFTTKHLNIIDPLKENNNLGRSISRSSYYRIKSAFSYGARKLGRILVTSLYAVPDNIAQFFVNTLQRNNITRLPDIEILINGDISELNITNNENASLIDGSESASGVLDLTGNLEVHLTSLRRINLHAEDIFVQLQEQIQGSSSLNFSTEDNLQDPVFQSATLTRWEANGSVSDPSPGTSSSPISGSCSTTEDQSQIQSQSQYLHSNCLSDSQSQQQQAFMLTNMNNGGVIQEMVPGMLQGSVSPQYSYDPYVNMGMQNSSWEIPYQYSMQYGIEETMWKQSQEWEMTYQEGRNSPYQSSGTGIYMNAGVNGHPLSPRVGLDNVSMQRGTGTFFPPMNFTNTQRDRRGGNGRPRKQASAYHLQRQDRNNNNTNSWNWGPSIKSNEKNVFRRGNQFDNLSYLRVDSSDTSNKLNSEQTPPSVGTDPRAEPTSPASHSIHLEKSVEFGSLGPVVLEMNSSQVCKSYELEEKAQAPEEIFEWSRIVTSPVPSESSIQTSTCLEMVSVPVIDHSWNMKGSLPESSSCKRTRNNQEKMNFPLMEVPSLCSKESAKVLVAPHPCKEIVMLNGKKAWPCTLEGDGKVLPDLHHRTWAEVSKRGALPYYLKDDLDFPPLAS